MEFLGLNDINAAILSSGMYSFTQRDDERLAQFPRTQPSLIDMHDEADHLRSLVCSKATASIVRALGGDSFRLFHVHG